MAYSKETHGQLTTFHIVPEAVPVPYGLLGIGALPVLIFLFINVSVAIGLAALFGALVWARMKVFPAARKFRSASTFSVSPEAVKRGDLLIRRQDIHRAVIRNHITAGDNPSGFVTLHQGVGAMTGAMGAAANAKFKGQLADISYRVDVEANGTPHTVACGLTEPAAFAVLADVSAVLGLS